MGTPLFSGGAFEPKCHPFGAFKTLHLEAPLAALSRAFTCLCAPLNRACTLTFVRKLYISQSNSGIETKQNKSLYSRDLIPDLDTFSNFTSFQEPVTVHLVAACSSRPAEGAECRRSARLRQESPASQRTKKIEEATME